MKRQHILAFLLSLLLVAAVAAAMVYFGVVQLNRPTRAKYPVRGVDVSSYQGEIDWPLLARQDISFAYIKATEGSSHVDTQFYANWRDGTDTDLRIGAYHFFSFDSPGHTQAAHFIQTVAPAEGMLPPAVDVEFYADKKKNPPLREAVQSELTVLLEALQRHYGIRPILYATADSYAQYLSGSFAAYDIWIRDVFSAPTLPDGREWTFWQYSNRMRLAGYKGAEPYIDMNAFAGDETAFGAYGRPLPSAEE